MNTKTRAFCIALAVATCLTSARLPLRAVEPSAASAITAESLKALTWRSIGPAMFAGRVVDVAGIPGRPEILYVGAASSGLYKSTNGGTTFESVFNDGGTLSIGAIAVQPDNPDVVYVGTGEGFVRNSISFGDGIYKTADGGRTWKNLGLRQSERFSRIVIHPSNPQIVLAAAMGHAFGRNTERGIFRSADAGATWTRTLYVDDTTGASDVAIDPGNPDIVYAGMYDYQRQPWHFRSGGPGSGLYRSKDGGVTWTKLTDAALKNGLPGGKVLGRIGVAVSRSNPSIVYALIESQDGVLWRSSDRGATWTMINSDRRINNRPFYYTQIRVDPKDPERLYTMSGSFNVSSDGGRSFTSVPGASMFGDHHALWIDPANPNRMLSGTDGGFFISNDRAQKWDFVNNMPMAQAYHVGVDMAEPYHVMGGFQDHEIWWGPSEKWNQAGVREGDWTRLRYMADGMHALADPRDPNIIYYNGHFGDITRLDLRNREERYIQPYPPGPANGGADLEQYRFNWNSPVHMSPTHPDVVYYGGSVLFRTKDGGTTWDIISPDLSTNDKSKQRSSGGPISIDNTRAEYHCTIISIAESAKDSNVIWAGTDDGNLQITRDGGKTWTNVAPNITGAPKFAWFSSISASSADAGTAYVTVDQHRLDDFGSYVFATRDYGKTWQRISNGLTGYAHKVLEDPREPSLLYAGTELGVFTSFDRGATWTDLRLGLPRLAVVDMVVHPRDNDLVIATHARGFFILDDVTPLQELTRAAARGPITAPLMFPPMRATRYTQASDTSTLGNRVWTARNRPYGAIVSYYLPSPGQRVQVAIVDQSGRTVNTFNAPGAAGLNRVVWNLSEASSCGPAPSGGRRGGRGRGGSGGTWVRAVPGTYSIRLSIDDRTETQPVTVRMDPRITVSDGDMREWHEQAATIERMECRADAAAAEVRDLDARLAKMIADGQSARDAEEARQRLRPLVLAFVGDAHDPGHVNLPGRINWLTIQVGNYSGRPTPAQMQWIATYSADVDRYVRQLEDLKKTLKLE